jgi:uncharacterized protein YbgA (DUF1722 family)/uncharacterized protein YbbK (DUF523 family)
MTEPLPQITAKPKLGIGACLIGQPVRFNGGHKKSSEPLENLKKVMQMVSFCPEVAIGLGVPREPIRLVATDNQLRAMDSNSQTEDYTEALAGYADKVADEQTNMAGYVLVKGSPSCGYERVKIYNTEGQGMASKGVGVFAQQLIDRQPLMPVEEDGRLFDNQLRENFIRRVYAYHDWLCLNEEPLSHHRLVGFYSRYKYLVMAHHVPTYKAIGQLLSAADKQHPEQQAQQLISLLMEVLKRPATRRGYSNALSHIQGYLKRDISSGERVSLDHVISQYRQGLVPLVVPATLLNHYFKQYPDAYIGQQILLSSYPDELGIGNHIL